MPSTIKVKVLEARGLPIMDTATQLADTYVQASLACSRFPLALSAFTAFAALPARRAGEIWHALR